MAIAALQHVPTNDAEWATWSFAHMAHHRDVQDAVYQTTGRNLVQFMLDPLDLRNYGPFVEQHQVMHNQQDALLGIGGFNFNDFDPNDKDSIEYWISQNFALHFAEGQATGRW